MQRILAVILTHDGYSRLLSSVRNSVLSLNVPSGYKLNKLEIVGKEFKDYPDKSNSITNFSQDNLKEIASLRNLYIGYARKMGYDWLLHVDGDIIVRSNALAKLLKADKKFIGGWAYNKKADGKYVDPDKIQYNDIYECRTIGNMFLLEHKDVFNKIDYFVNDSDYSDAIGHCKKVREMGEQCFVHSGVKCTHLLKNGLIYEP